MVSRRLDICTYMRTFLLLADVAYQSTAERGEGNYNFSLEWYVLEGPWCQDYCKYGGF